MQTSVEVSRRAVFRWDYDFGSAPDVARLVAQGQDPGWRLDQLDWAGAPPADLVSLPVRDPARVPDRSPFARLDANGWRRFDTGVFRFRMSQLLHGEQLAGLCAAATVEIAPAMDAKAFAVTQAADEIRHAEGLARYLTQRLGGIDAIEPQVQALFADVLASESWDLLYLGNQVLVEGLGLATIGAVLDQTTDPLLAELLALVMRDEARHVAFGVITLREVVAEMSAAELRHRATFVLDAVEALRRRLVPADLLEELELPVVEATRMLRMSNVHEEARLFRHVVRICGHLGLADADGGWLRKELSRRGLVADRP